LLIRKASNPGVPAILGRGGIEEIIELGLTGEERADLA
jgi:malate/lactate dehydrogenase